MNTMKRLFKRLFIGNRTRRKIRAVGEKLDELQRKCDEIVFNPGCENYETACIAIVHQLRKVRRLFKYCRHLIKILKRIG